MKSERSAYAQLSGVLISTLLSLVLAGASFAQSDVLTCDDVEFSEDVRSRHADINEACLAVIEKEGEPYAKLEARVVKASNRRVTLRYRHRDGSWGQSVRSNELPSDFRVSVRGKRVRPRELKRGQELELYVKIGGEYAVQLVEDDDEDAVPESQAITVAFVPVPTELPKTASPLPAVALVGGLCLLAGAALTWRRRALG